MQNSFIDTGKADDNFRVDCFCGQKRYGTCYFLGCPHIKGSVLL
jgi:hypothetical protein